MWRIAFGAEEIVSGAIFLDDDDYVLELLCGVRDRCRERKQQKKTRCRAFHVGSLLLEILVGGLDVGEYRERPGSGT